MPSREFSIDNAFWTIFENKFLIGDLELYMKTMRSPDPKISFKIQEVLRNNNLGIGDLPEISELVVKELNIQVKPETKETALIQHKENIRIIRDVGNISISDRVRTTNVWRRVSSGDHVYSILWRSRGGGESGRGIGILLVAFASGGHVQGNNLPVYMYQGVAYDEYYELWKRIQSPGAFVHRVLRGRSYRPFGMINKSEVEE